MHSPSSRAGTPSPTGATPPAATSTPPAPPCDPASRVAANLQRLVSPAGGPDDLLVIGDAVYISLINAGRVIRLGADGGTTVVASGLRVPEGLAPAPGGDLYVVEQGLNRIDRVSLDGSGRIAPIKEVPNRTGLMGMDSIHIEENGLLLVPDSPNGRLLELDPRTGVTSVLASGLGRPVDAIRWSGGIAIADERLGLLLVPADAPRPAPPAMVEHAAGIPLADDLQLDSQGALLITGLQDGRVYRYQAGQTAVVASGFQSPQGMAMRPSGDLLIADEVMGSVLVLPARCIQP
jgi:sugar lactone lactonase YvrE